MGRKKINRREIQELHHRNYRRYRKNRENWEEGIEEGYYYVLKDMSLD